MAKSLAEQLADFANPEPKDFDPEDLETHGSDDEDTSDVNDEAAARAHYVPVGRSMLRDRAGAAELEKLGKYQGAKVTRQNLNDSNVESGSESSSESQVDSNQDSEEDPEEDSEDESKTDNGVSISPSDGESDADDARDKNKEPKKRSTVGQILADEQKAILERLGQQSQVDVVKGRAVQAQMRQFEDLLDMRITSQKILNETNNGLKGQSNELLQLISVLLNKRDPAKPLGTKRSLAELEEDTQALDAELAQRRETVLTRWSRKVQLSHGRNAMQSQQQKFRSLAQSAASQVTSVLGDMDRLVARTRVNRSNYSVDESQLFDDTDFYRLLLKDLVDRRMTDSNLAPGVQWKAAKTKKNVDTKASKGRKLRYHVQEKIQGFDAPRTSVYSWSNEQAEDLYSHLLGFSVSMDDNEPESETEIVPENFALFG